MKFAGEHLQDGLANHDSKYFFYSLMAVFSASYCGLYFLNLDQIPTVIIALGITLAIYSQFRLRVSLKVQTTNISSNNRNITTVENTSAFSSSGGLTSFMLQIYLWCGLSMKKNNRILTSNLAKLPLQFFKQVKISSGLMEKTIPWKIFYMEDSGSEFNNLIQQMLMLNFMEESHRMMIVSHRPSELFDTTIYDEIETVNKITEYHSLGRPLTVFAHGLTTDEIRYMVEETEMAVIPVKFSFEESSLFISIGSPVLHGSEIEIYLQVESNRISRIRE